MRQRESRGGNWRKKYIWLRGGGGYTNVIFCPQTPGVELAKIWREVEASGASRRGWRFELMELGGQEDILPAP